MDIICAFLAILEAVKFSMVTIHQHALFGDIVIRKKQDFDPNVIDDEDFGDEEPYESFLMPQNTQAQQPQKMEHPTFSYDDVDDEIIDLTDDDDQEDV